MGAKFEEQICLGLLVLRAFAGLVNRHMQNNSQCPLCTLDCERICHAYFQCPRVKDVLDHLRKATIIQDACNTDRDHCSVLGCLLLDKTFPRQDSGDADATGDHSCGAHINNYLVCVVSW